MTDTEKAIRALSGPQNAALRADLRACKTREQALAIASRVALTGSGRAKLEAVAEALPSGPHLAVTYRDPSGYETEASDWGGERTEAALRAHVGSLIDWGDRSARVADVEIVHEDERLTLARYRVEVR